MDIVDKSVKNSKFPKIFSVKLLTLQEVVLRCVHAKQIPKLSEAVGGQMVVLIGRLSKSSKIGGELENSNFFSKTIYKLEFSICDAYKLNISRTT